MTQTRTPRLYRPPAPKKVRKCQRQRKLSPPGTAKSNPGKPVRMRGTTDQRTQISQLVPTAAYGLESNVSRPRDRQVERVIELGVDASTPGHDFLTPCQIVAATL